VHELQVPDAAPVGFLQPFEFAVEEIEPLDIADDGRLPGLVRGFEVGGDKCNPTPGEKMVARRVPGLCETKRERSPLWESDRRLGVKGR
jgi:hypothetical protein